MIKKIISGMILLSCSINSNAYEMSALGYEDVGIFINEYSNKDKYTKDELIEIFARTKITKEVIKSSKNQPEVKLTWKKYRDRVVTNLKIKKGKEFLNDNLDVLNKAEQKYGVPKEIIVSIIGIESFYGKYKGNHNAMNAISTMAFEGSERRQKYFKQELEKVLDYSFENNLNPLDLKSSWAGAFGYPQFMPSSILAYAVDFNQDGKIDLINSIDDSIGSIGNYLKENGWKKEHFIAEQVYNVSADYKLSGFNLNYTVQDLKDNNIKIKRNMRNSKKLKLFKLDNNGIEYWIGYNNFQTITRYNRSNLYAMAVFDLANKIKGSEVK